MKRLANYLDEHGFIGHFDDNGVLEFGDGLQRFSMMGLFTYLTALRFHGAAFAAHIIEPFMHGYKSIFVDEEPTRHWDHTKWFGKQGTCSRDQLRPAFCALAAMGQAGELWSLFKKLAKRGFFAWNTKHIGQHDDKWKVPDFIGIAPMHSFLRGGMRVYPLLMLLWPFLLITDFFIFINVLFRLVVGIIDRNDSSNDLNMTCDLLLIKQIGPQTPFSWVAHELYFGLMPVAKLKDPDRIPSPIGVISRFQNYFEGDRNPPLDLQAEDAILKLS